MSRVVNADALTLQIEKEAEMAVYEGRNRAYAKGMRDAAKITKEYAVDNDISVKPETGGTPRTSTWWFVCGACRTAIDRGDLFCRKCGRPIGWEEEQHDR